MVETIVVWRVALGMVRWCERCRLVPVDGVEPEEGLYKAEYEVSSTTDSTKYGGPQATH
jgi:hypothetical protein